jgi:hypothetical protein
MENWNKKEDLIIFVYKRPILLTEINTGLGRKAKRLTKLLHHKTGNTNIRQSRLQPYIDQKRQGRSLHTNKRDNTSKENSKAGM